VARSFGSVLGFVTLSSVPDRLVAWTVPLSLSLLMLATLVASFQSSLFEASPQQLSQDRQTCLRDNMATPGDITASESSHRDRTREVLSILHERVPIRLAIFSNYLCFAEPLLSELREAGVDVVLVSSTSTALAEVCLQRGVNFSTFPKCPDGLFFARSCRDLPEYRAKVEDAYSALRACKPDVLLTAGFYVLPAEVLAIPTKAAINMHPADLPRYRGGMPLEAHILRGEPFFKICVHRTTEIIDDPRHVLAVSGPQPLGSEATIASMQAQIASELPSLVVRALHRLSGAGAEGAAPSSPPIAAEGGVQDLELPHAFAVRAELVSDPAGGTAAKSNAGVLGRARIEWGEDSAADIERAARAFVGGHGLYTDYEGVAWVVQGAALDSDASISGASLLPGTVLEVDFDESAGLMRAKVATCDHEVLRLSGCLLDTRVPSCADDACPPALRVGGRFHSTTPLSSFLGRSRVDRLPTGTRYA